MAGVLSDNSVTAGPPVCVHCTLRSGPRQPPAATPASTPTFTAFVGGSVNQTSLAVGHVGNSGGTGYTVSSASALVTWPALLPTTTEKRAPSSPRSTTFV